MWGVLGYAYAYDRENPDAGESKHQVWISDQWNSAKSVQMY